MSKHTPGPWMVAEKFNCADVRAVNGPYVASCNVSMAIDWKEKEANARLIAAAPELLEVLQSAVTCGMVPSSTAADGGANKHSEWVRVADQIRAAINKATGE